MKIAIANRISPDGVRLQLNRVNRDTYFNLKPDQVEALTSEFALLLRKAGELGFSYQQTELVLINYNPNQEKVTSEQSEAFMQHSQSQADALLDWIDKPENLVTWKQLLSA
ncbi:hypothetical protein [Tellurirhabdus bombi]|uniref:hypothetical protein n=1 Tax=Tellurirhabdus bombi TaxID=2907205 RepID=UPI001F447F51|nr:hypothetical protein [Tellurirhabdus bombi]